MKSNTDEVTFTRDILEEALFFSDQKVETFNFEDNPKKPTIGITLKRSSENLPSNVIDDIVLQVVYGNSRQHPGEKNSPSQKYLRTDPDGRQFIGFWAPPNIRCKALALKLLFPSLAKAYKLPEYKQQPLHVAMAYDTFKTEELMDLSKQYPGGVMRFGFFSCDDPIQAQLLGKTVQEFESRGTGLTYEEKIIFQISKENKECFQAFLNMGPSYKSANVEVGEVDCKMFFPSGYDAPLEEEKIVTKKSKKKKAKVIQEEVKNNGEEMIETMISDGVSLEEAGTQREEEKIDTAESGENEDEEEDEEDDVTDDVTIVEAEKATSPREEM